MTKQLTRREKIRPCVIGFSIPFLLGAFMIIFYAPFALVVISTVIITILSTVLGWLITIKPEDWKYFNWETGFD